MCRGWQSLSIMQSSLLRILLCAVDVSDSTSMPTTEPAFLTSLSSRPASLFLVLSPHYTVPQHTVEEDTVHDGSLL